MLIFSMNNRFDQLAIFLARFLHNYKKTPFNARVGSLDSCTSGELIWKGYTTKRLVDYIEGPLLLFQMSRWLSYRPTFFRSCRLICSGKEGPNMYTICHQMLIIASASEVPPVLPRPSCGTYDAPHTRCLHAKSRNRSFGPFVFAATPLGYSSRRLCLYPAVDR